jgi:hypothetical protein
MTKRLPGWLRLLLLMAGWALIVKGLTIAIWLGAVVAFVLAVLWLYRLRSTAWPDEDWISTILFAAAWVAWSLFGWFVLLFGIYLGYFAGAYLGLWEIHDS